MDSNFQVKITADLSDLQARLKNVESALNKLGVTAETANKQVSKSFEQTSVAAQKLGADMSRGRLAAFAFGQVIRDAGFFSQNFGLGLLAVSNNIPILIDQLVLLSGVSAGFGAALSLLGSALAAGLTIFAYWAQGVERNGSSVSAEISKMANDSGSAIGKLVNYLNTPPASNMLGAAVAGLEEAAGLIKQIMSAVVDFSIAVWDNFGSDISDVFKIFYDIVYNTMNNVLNIFRLAGSVVKGDFGGAFTAIGNIAKNVINNIIGLIQSFVRVSSTLFGTLVGAVDPLKGEAIKAAGKQLVQFGDSIKFAREEAAESSFSFKDFFNNLFDGSGKAGKAKTAIDGVRQSVEELNKAQSVGVSQDGAGPRTSGNVEVISLTAAAVKAEMDALNAYMQMKGEEMAAILNDGMVMTVGNAMYSLGAAFAMGGNAAQAFGSAILGSLSSILSQLADKLIAAGLAGLAFSTAMKNLFNPANWGVALAAGIALKVAAGAAGGFARNLSGGGGGIGGSMSASPTPTFGGMAGINPNTGMNATSSIAASINAAPVLETKISGNDLVILMNRSSNTRNSYF